MAEPIDPLDGVDPRVQIELERLNTATDDINKLEVDLDEARLVFRQLLFESTFKIQSLAKKLGNCIDKSRPYYEARYKANKALHDMRQTAVLFEKANSAHSAAREMVYLAEQGLCKLCEEASNNGASGVPLDPAWQEMLNHATSRVNQAESERATAGARHRITVEQHRTSLNSARNLQNSLKRHIAKSRPYFEEKARYNSLLDAQKNKVQALEKEVSNAKLTYAQALRNLEKISDEIHRYRSKYMQNKSSSSDTVIQENNDQKTDVSSTVESNNQVGLNSETKKEDETTDKSESKQKNVQLSKSDSIREWIKQNGTSSPVNDFDDALTDSINTKKLNVIRPKSLPQDFNDKYCDILTPFQQNPPNKPTPPPPNHQNKGSTSTCSTVSRNGGPESDNWIEINLEYSSPEDTSFEKCSNFSNLDSYKQIPYERMPIDEITQEDSVSQNVSPVQEVKSASNAERPKVHIVPNSKVSADSPRRIIRNKLVAQKSLPANPADVTNHDEDNTENGNESQNVGGNKLRSKLKPDISTWISRSSAKNDEDFHSSPTRRQSFDIILNDTGEKVKEIFNQGFMMFNISSLTERRNSEPKVPQTEKLSPNQKPAVDQFNPDVQPAKGVTNKTIRKMPSPLDKTFTYLNVYNENSASTNSDDQGSDTDSLASVEMLSDDQVHLIMMDGQLEAMCQMMLGINEKDAEVKS